MKIAAKTNINQQFHHSANNDYCLISIVLKFKDIYNLCQELNGLHCVLLLFSGLYNRLELTVD